MQTHTESHRVTLIRTDSQRLTLTHNGSHTLRQTHITHANSPWLTKTHTAHRLEHTHTVSHWRTQTHTDWHRLTRTYIHSHLLTLTNNHTNSHLLTQKRRDPMEPVVLTRNHTVPRTQKGDLERRVYICEAQASEKSSATMSQHQPS